VKSAGPSDHRPNLRDRIVANQKVMLGGPYERPRAQPVMTLLMAAVGFGVSIMIVTSFAKTWTMSTPVTVAVLAGGTLVAAATYLTGLPTRAARPNAEFWGGGALTRLVISASFCTVAALIWGFALIFLFETRLPR
jgi:hypothetical protein